MEFTALFWDSGNNPGFENLFIVAVYVADVVVADVDFGPSPTTESTRPRCRIC